MFQNKDKSKFKNICKLVRVKTLKSIYKAGSGHIGPSLSIVEILVYLIFFKKIFNKKNLSHLILSKGHAVPSLYAALSVLGKISEKNLMTLRKVNSRLQGHPDKEMFKLMDASTGALGQGISIAIGYAMANKMKKNNRKVFCIIGDGEMQEGQIWESAMFISAKKIKNLCIIIDYNKFQNELSIKETLPMGNIKKKWESFGFQVKDIDGHSFNHISKSINSFIKNKNKKPIVICLNTIKGKGVSFMENKGEWHSKKLDTISFNNALKELG